MKTRGFTLIELAVTLGMLAVLFTLTSFAVLTSIHHADQKSVETTLLSDIHLQQLKAMQGDTEGQTQAYPYGVYFNANQYTLFRGSTYTSNDPNNYTVIQDTNFSFSPETSLVFARGSGEISSPVTFFLTEANSGVIHSFFVNKYGVVSQN
ncbi:MAG: type II secretion system protein [Patescibacteria group bacterium]